MDSGDKATNKAMSAAYKYAMFQTFCIPVEGTPDADGDSHEVKAKANGSSKPIPCPACRKCGGATEFVEAGSSKDSGKPYAAFWKCASGCGAEGSTWDADFKKASGNGGLMPSRKANGNGQPETPAP